MEGGGGMRRLAWFAGGFGAACLWACYFPPGTRPMLIAALAAGLELHPSTVSRAIRGKYLQCRQGTYPLRYFFSLPVSGGVSRQAAKQALLSLVREEDRKRPYSDQDLSRLLADRGILLARRTVTKYRLELGLGSSAARKK